MDKATPGNTWHALDADLVCQHFQVSVDQGLTSDQVVDARSTFGLNQIPEGQSRSPFLVFFSQFTDLMVLILLAAALISGLVGEFADTLTILVIVILNAVIGFMQEMRAEKAMKALKDLAAPLATVRRGGQVATIEAEELVPGDIVLLDAGALVPADGRLIEAANLRIDESTLTGESEPVDKQSTVIAAAQAVMGDRLNMAFKGTQLTHGRALFVVTETGLNTELGRIATLLEKEEQTRTPLQERLTVLGRQLAFVVLFICIVLFTVGLLRGEPAMLMFLTAISLAVAAIPEALPAVINIALAIGARRMSQHNALIRQLPAVESLGSVTFICTDKTGTLTLNRMQATHVFCGVQWEDVLAAKPETVMQQAMLLCNDVAFSEEEYIGDPTETAILEYIEGAGLSKEQLQQKMPRVAELAFDSERKSMTTIHSLGDGFISYSKGSPERILDICSRDVRGNDMTREQRQVYLEQATQMASQGRRILGFAQARLNTLPETIDEANVESELQFLGFISLIDPPRAEAKEAVRLCKSAGIVPVMITGDHANTATAIARELGIAEKEENAVSGEELLKLSDAELQRIVMHKHVYARVTPEQKIRIVEALQQQGQFVAMTGDGVNDAPALRFAHVGIAMGKKGTDVAREASDVILLDDNFATIVFAVKEGRRIYDNIRKFIRYTMTSNAGEVWTLLLAPLMGLPVPLLPIHILWINLVTDGLPGLTLSLEKEEPDVMQRPPRSPQESVFARGMWQHILVIGMLIGLMSLGVQVWAINNDNAHWQTMVFTVLTFSQLAHVLAIRSETQSIIAYGIFSNFKLLLAVILTVLLQLMIIYVPFFNDVFKTQPLSVTELLICFTLPLFVIVAVEFEKYLVRRFSLYRDKTLKHVSP